MSQSAGRSYYLKPGKTVQDSTFCASWIAWFLIAFSSPYFQHACFKVCMERRTGGSLLWQKRLCFHTHLVSCCGVLCSYWHKPKKSARKLAAGQKGARDVSPSGNTLREDSIFHNLKIYLHGKPSFCTQMKALIEAFPFPLYYLCFTQTGQWVWPQGSGSWLSVESLFVHGTEVVSAMWQHYVFHAGL